MSTIADEGTSQGSATFLNFIGAGVTATVASNTASITITGGGAGSISVGDESVTQGTATYFNFIGAGVSATVASSTASVNIPGGSGLTTKSNVVTSGTFTGSPRKAAITFTSAFANTNYAITITGDDARSWTIESKATTGFTINSNSSQAITGNTYWHAIAYGEA